MNTKQDNKFSMYLAVVSVCDGDKPSWQGLKAFKDAYTEFKGQVATIQKLSPKTGKKPAGVTQDKRRVRAELADVTYEVAAATSAFAAKTKNGDLAQKVNLSRSEIITGRDTESASRSQTVLDAATPVVGQLADYGVTQDDLDVLEGLLETYRDVLPKPREARIEAKSATQQVADAFDAADAILNDRMDTLLPKLRKASAEFADNYENARIIVDASASRNTDKKPAPVPA